MKSRIFPIAAFLGSFLLFLLEPMAAKQLLPGYGGSAAVWTAALLFFQIALLAGYAYANWATPRMHGVFLGLMALSLALRTAGSTTAPPEGLPPVAAVLWALAASIGVPFVAIAAGSTLLQRWAGSYRLYSISNAGSLLALFVYPLLVEPTLDARGQRLVWTCGALLYAILMGWCLRGARDVSPSAGLRMRPAISPLLWWTAWSAIGSGLLAAATSQICQEVASIPFLWVLPLAIYLLSFILVFQDGGHWWKSKAVWSLLAPVAIAVAIVLQVSGPRFPYPWAVAADLAVLGVCAMRCHVELAASKPGVEHLGWFYLAIASGGVMGGLFTAVIAPLLFDTYAEFPILLAACGALALARGLTDGAFLGDGQLSIHIRTQVFALAAAAVIPLALFSASAPGLLEERRNFYGVLRVTEHADPDGPLRTFTHGRTKHGTQWVTHPDWPTAYYTGSSGVAHVLSDAQRAKPEGVKVGVIGLGAGTLAHYARPRDSFRFYELNPDVEALARRYFTYLNGKNADVVLGDARLSLAREREAQGFDVLVVDAFSSDAIPVHLLTREAADLYSLHVKREGAIAIHISNRVLNLEPVTRGLARYLNRRFDLTVNVDQKEKGGANSTWAILGPGEYEGPAGMLWTDAYSSLWNIVKIR